MENIIQQVWPEWQIEKELGRGSYGVVYRAVRNDHNLVTHAAIKVISIPSNAAEIDTLRSEGLDMNATRTYLQEIVNDFVSEIRLMESLKGIQNIVSVEDYKVVEKTNELGWNIFIRTELLTPFNTLICDKKLTEPEVIRLGCDICTALEVCAKRNVIHRDIKPENIFVNDFGDYKLGDFGIARTLENMTGGLSQKGTYNYMAPEVAISTEYDATVDLYSLGIVLYRLLNGNRLPFLDTDKQLLNPNERKLAVERRLRGEALSAPSEASPAMANLILKACAPSPHSRFRSATEMKAALMSVKIDTDNDKADILGRTISVRRPMTNLEETESVRHITQSSLLSESCNNSFDKVTICHSFDELITWAKNDNLVAMYLLGECYLNGVYTEKDEQKAIYWLSLASSKESHIAQYGLACVWYFKKNANQDEWAKAASLFRSAAEGGHIWAQNNYSVALGRGRGVERVNLRR